MVSAAAVKVEVWAPQVTELLEAVNGLAYVAGGAARQVVMRGLAPEADDIDLFLYRAEDYYACCEVLRSLEYGAIEETDHSVTFPARDFIFELPVQLIRPFRDVWSLTYGDPVDVLAHFCFTTECFALLPGGEAVIGPGAEADTRDRRLVVQNITDPLTVALRVAKYAAKGYHIAAVEMQKLFEAWEARRGSDR